MIALGERGGGIRDRDFRRICTDGKLVTEIAVKSAWRADLPMGRRFIVRGDGGRSVSWLTSLHPVQI